MRGNSNSLWHTDWKLLEGYGWIIAYLDDASRFIVRYGIFKSYIGSCCRGIG